MKNEGKIKRKGIFFFKKRGSVSFLKNGNKTLAMLEKITILLFVKDAEVMELVYMYA